MTEQNSFTIDLVSNGSFDVYPDNTISKFVNRIDPPLELNGDWEAALTELYFPLRFAEPKLSIKYRLRVRTGVLIINQEFPFIVRKVWEDVPFLSESEIEINKSQSLHTIIQDLNDSMKKDSEICQKEFGPDSGEHPYFGQDKSGKVFFHHGWFSNRHKSKVYYEEVASNDASPGLELYDKYIKSRVENMVLSNQSTEVLIKKTEGEEVTQRRGYFLVPEFENEEILKYFGFDMSAKEFVDSFIPHVRETFAPNPWKRIDDHEFSSFTFTPIYS